MEYVAKRIEQSSESRVPESNASGSGMVVDFVDAVREIVAITLWGGQNPELQKMTGELEHEERCCQNRRTL